MYAAGTGSQWLFSPAVESAWGDTTLNLRAILPGVAPNDVKVTVQNNQLLIEGERRSLENSARSGYTQLAYGKFRSEVPLPAGLDLDKVNCHLHDGVLDIQIPVAEKMRPRQIQIHAGDQRKSVSA